MAKKNPINRAAEAKFERQYGKTSSMRVPNMLQDKRAGRQMTGSFLRYAAGEMRAVSINGGKSKRIGAAQLAREIETRRRRATGRYRGMKL